MIVTIYESKRFRTENLAWRRYVRKDATGEGYSWCLTSPRTSFDVAQGRCDADDIPAEIRALADARRGLAFSYVDWPMENEHERRDR